jgi:hypothetical protein
VTAHHLRALCKCGLIEAEQSAGGQWRIPLTEIERLEREGVPAAPTFIQEASELPVRAAPARVRQDLYADPSPEVIGAREKVNIRQSQLEARRLDKEIEETEDFFRDRERREAALKAAQQEATEAAQNQQRQAAEAAQAERRRQEQIRQWEQYALSSLPWGHPQEAELAVHKAAQELLPTLDLDQAQYITQRLVGAAVEQAYRPWRLQKAAEDAKVAHLRTCQTALLFIYVSGATSAEQEEAKGAVRKALFALPIGATQKQIDNAKQAALAPLEAAVAKRKEAAALQAQQQRKRRDVQSKVSLQLGYIQTYLEKEYEFDGGYFEMMQERGRLWPLISEALVDEILEDPTMDTDDIRARIEELVDDDLLR